MSTPTDFGKLMPGFEFLQDLVKNAGAALPGIGQWVAPTLDPAELEKRIQELRTVQYWLDQNSRMMSATIQALEVQRMTLSTLKTMNVQMGDLHEAMKIRMPEPAAAAATSWPGKVAAEPPAQPSAEPPTGGAEAASPAGMVDPMQWWGALTKQFTELATQAVQVNGEEAARRMATAMAAPAAPTAAGETADASASHKAPARKKAAAKRTSDRG